MFNGLRNLKAITAALLDRLELYPKLLAVEAKIERTLLVRRLVWASIGALFAIFAIAMIHIAVIGFFWPSEYRILAIAGVLLIDTLIASIALYMASRPALQEPFAVTKHQLSEDIKFMKDSL